MLRLPEAPTSPSRSSSRTGRQRRRLDRRRRLSILGVIATAAAAMLLVAFWPADGAPPSITIEPAPPGGPTAITSTHALTDGSPVDALLAPAGPGSPWLVDDELDVLGDRLAVENEPPAPPPEPTEDEEPVAAAPDTDEAPPEPTTDGGGDDRAEEPTAAAPDPGDEDAGSEPTQPTESNAGSLAARLAPSNTGFRGAGLTEGDLSPSGTITTTHDGQVIENVDVQGGIRVRHRDVVIRNARVRHQGGYGINNDSGGDVGTVTITNVEVDGGGVADGIGIYLTAPVQVTRAHVHSQRVGMQINSNSSIVESYIHSQAVASGTHNTAMSSHGASNIVIRNNRLESSTSASLSLYPRTAPIVNATVEGNLFEGAGRGIGLYAGYTSNHDHRDQNRDIRIVGNRWTGQFQHGTHLAWNSGQPGNVWDDNRWLDGARIDG